MSRFPFFNRSNTVHASSTEPSQKPFDHLLDRSGSLSKFYGSVESVKSSIRGRMVKKLCNLFELPGSKPSVASEPKRELLPISKLGSDSGMLFRLAGAEDRIVVYLTSLRGIRRTFEDCNAVKMILKGFRVWVDERDVSMDRAYRKELQVQKLLLIINFDFLILEMCLFFFSQKIFTLISSLLN